MLPEKIFTHFVNVLQFSISLNAKHSYLDLVFLELNYMCPQELYHIYPNYMYSDSQVWVNSVAPDQMPHFVTSD